MKSKFRFSRKALAYPYMLFLLLFVVTPLVIILINAFLSPDNKLTLNNFVEFFSNSGGGMTVLGNSLLIGIVTTVICLAIGYPCAYLLAKYHASNKVFVLMFILPMWMNFLLRTLAWQTLLEKNGVINGILSFLHLPNIAIINTPWAIILGMVYNFLPFMILPIYNVLAKIDDNTINAAKDLGANNFQTLIHIWIPLSIPGIISGITMVFVPALTTFVISSLLGGSKILLIGNVIEQEFTKGSNWHLGSGLSLVLMIFILLSMALIAKYDKEGEGNAF